MFSVPVKKYEKNICYSPLSPPPPLPLSFSEGVLQRERLIAIFDFMNAILLHDNALMLSRYVTILAEKKTIKKSSQNLKFLQ